MNIKQKRKKPMFSVTIDKDVLECFDYCAEKHSINKSLLIQNYLKVWIEENEPKVFKELETRIKNRPTDELDSFIKK